MRSVNPYKVNQPIGIQFCSSYTFYAVGMTSKIHEDSKLVLVQKLVWCLAVFLMHCIVYYYSHYCMSGGTSHALDGCRYLIVSSEQCLQLEDKSAQ